MDDLFGGDGACVMVSCSACHNKALLHMPGLPGSTTCGRGACTALHLMHAAAGMVAQTGKACSCLVAAAPYLCDHDDSEASAGSFNMAVFL